MPRNTSVTLGEYFDKYFVEKINEGRYQSANVVVRSGLRKLEEDEAKLLSLRNKLQAGENSHLVVNFDGEEYWQPYIKNMLNDCQIYVKATGTKRSGRNLAIPIHSCNAVMPNLPVFFHYRPFPSQSVGNS